ncbi:CRAL/TRIO domain protein [Talaromyces proteolyticus]|uniref:CRAL/TRIO domain protein n=1 Tax=Talaromyces proteolyticus TaxID=1131652 RepID=A0AAD4L5C5_9EURO|nr:CRAL/TRIO domain protein [Talaromyces proteolyticus]KAH8705376.1 CRAL/TRIO domain protein [Talaromyces proteolyticus]
MAVPETENVAVNSDIQPAGAPDDLDLPLSADDGLIKKPFGSPIDGVTPQPAAELTADQAKKYNEVFQTVSGWSSIPSSSAKGAQETPLTDDERLFLTRECLIRYLRATKWNVADAIKRLRATLVWRREYIGDKLTPEYISIENETGKQLILGYDIHGRPCLNLLPSRQNTDKSPRQLEHLVFMVERLIELMPAGQETMALVINFNETKSGQNATIGQAKQSLDILQNHYPERLGRALIINIPWIIWGFFKIITPFIDPVTAQKLRFNEDLRKHVPPSQLLKTAGGDVQFEYDHSVYWPALNKLAQQHREAYRERWVKAGKKIGESEFYLRGGTNKSQFADASALEEKVEKLDINEAKAVVAASQ